MAWDIGADKYVAGVSDTTLTVQDLAHAHGIDNLILPTFLGTHANFGCETVGASSYTFVGSVVGSKFTLAARGEIVSLSGYVGRTPAWDIGADQRGANTVGSVQFALYDTSGNLLGETASGTLGTAAWLTLDLLAPYDAAAGDYIIVANSDDAVGFIKYEATGGTGYIVAQAFDTWPDPISLGADGTKQYSLYATYHPQSADTLLVVADLTHAHVITEPVLSPLGTNIAGESYLEQDSLSITLGGAGVSPSPIGASWSAKIASPGGIFSHFHPSSLYKDYFRVGREVRLSIGGEYNGIEYWWTRLTGYMDPPEYDFDSQSLSISGGDRMKRLEEAELRSPDNYWGDVSIQNTVATGGTGSEIYAEADACDIAGDANNVTGWADGGTGGTFSSVTPGQPGAGHYALQFVRDEVGPTAQYVHKADVGTSVAATDYLIRFWGKIAAGTNYARLIAYQTVGGVATQVGYTSISVNGNAWTAYSLVFHTDVAAAIQLRLDTSGKYAAAGDTVLIDEITLKTWDPATWNEYPVPTDCNGPYFVTLDNSDGLGAVPIFQGDTADDKQSWTYDETARLFKFTKDTMVVAGDSTLKIYYYQTQQVEDVVADILVRVGYYENRPYAKAAMDYTATGVSIPRVWFEAGTTALAAIRLLCERVNYRFWFGPDGTPRFKPAPAAGTSVFDFAEASDVQAPGVRQERKEIWNRVVIEGIERGMYQTREDKQTSRFTGEASDATSIAAYGEKTLTIKNHLFQTQAALDAMCATLLAAYKDPKWYSTITVPANPVPLELGDTITWVVPVTLIFGALYGSEYFGFGTYGGDMVAFTGIVRDIQINSDSQTLTCEITSPA